jgi:hypothetical protein
MGDPLKGRPHAAETSAGNPPERKEELLMKMVRRLLISVGAIAAFMMAAGAGWKN